MLIAQDRLPAASNAANEPRSESRVALRECPNTSHVRMAALPKPQPQPKRWVMHRKAEVLDAVRGGALSLDDALERYALSMEEYLSWQHAISLFGLRGLRVSRTQQARCGRARFPAQ